MKYITAKYQKINPVDLKLRYGQDRDYENFINYDALIKDEKTGSVVLAVKTNAFPKEITEPAFAAMYSGRKIVTRNRGNYAGSERSAVYRSPKITYSEPVASLTAGSFERQGGRNKCCRKCSWNRDNPKQWNKLTPLIKSIAREYKKIAPDKYAKQANFSKKIHSDWLIEDTPFTTVTINNTVKAAYHTDSGDYKGGLGCLYTLTKGPVLNWDLVIPEYKLRIEIKNNTLILFEPHLWHANYGAAKGLGKANKSFSRVSLVCYAREKMQHCGSAKEEIEKAKRL